MIASGDCSSNPCLNGGSCFNTGNSFVCLCRQEFSGPTCSFQTSVTTPALTTATSKFIFQYDDGYNFYFSKVLALVHQIHV